MTKRIKIEKRSSGEYAYEVTSNYDPKIKNSRPTKRYLGKVVRYDDNNKPIYKPRWIKKYVLKSILEEPDALPYFSTFIETLIHNSPYQIADNEDFFVDSAIQTKVTKDFFYISKHIAGINRNIEVFISPYDPKCNYINIDTMRVGDRLKDRPIPVVFSSERSALSKLNMNRMILIRKPSNNQIFQSLTEFKDAILGGRDVNLVAQNKNSLIVVMLIEAFLSLVEEHSDLNSSICKSLSFVIKKTVEKCYQGKVIPEKALWSSYKEIRKMSDTVDS